MAGTPFDLLVHYIYIYNSHLIFLLARIRHPLSPPEKDPLSYTRQVTLHHIPDKSKRTLVPYFTYGYVTQGYYLAWATQLAYSIRNRNKTWV